MANATATVSIGVIMDLPLIKGFVYTGEWRPPQKDEFFLSDLMMVVQAERDELKHDIERALSTNTELLAENAALQEKIANAAGLLKGFYETGFEECVTAAHDTLTGEGKSNG